MNIKTRFKLFLCRNFGCITYTEVYAREIWRMKRNGPVRYEVVTKNTCSRCGKEHVSEISDHLTRAELLKEGWFIEK